MTRREISKRVRASRRRAAAFAPALAFALALAVLGCGREDEPAGPIRLVDELANARIDTPLAGLEPWQTVRENLEERPFWSPRLGAGRGLSRGCRATSDSEFVCEVAEEKRFAVAFRPELRPHTRYRIQARVWSTRNGCVNLRLGDLRETRAVRPPLGAGTWVEVSEPWHTGGTGGKLRIAFRGKCKVRIDGLELRELVVGPDEELSALAAQAVSPFAADEMGMVKFGSLLPHQKAEEVAPPFDENWSFREAILAPAPTDVTYPVTVPRGGRLRFSYALSDMSRLGDRATFEVLVAAGKGAPETLWSDQLVLTPESWHWHEAVLGLERYAGKEIELILRTRSSGERGYAVWGAPSIDRPRRKGEPPNIVVIAVDTLRADRLSGYGYDKATSPHLDALARDGSLFLYPVSQSTQTPPSFASLFTGQVVPRHGFLFATSRLAPNVPTLARVLRQNGWTTHGAAFHAALYDLTLARGFERYFNLPRTKHLAQQNLEKGLDFLEANGDRRFFFFLHFSDPHQPFTQPEEFVQEETAAVLADLGVELPFNVRGSIGDCAPCKAEGGLPAELRPLINDLYDESVNYVDDRIGVFLQELEDRGLYDDTIIAFVSDHGETLWDHYDFFDHGGFNQHDELTRVPLIIKPAAGRGFAAGAVVRTQVRSFDLMPTLLELAGVEAAPLDMDARSLVPLLREGAPTGRQEEEWALSSNEQSASLRGNGWKWTFAARPVAELGGPEGLFDLRNDPEERVNVAAQNPSVVRGMRARYMETVLDAVGGSHLLVLGEPPPAGRSICRVRLTEPGPFREKPIDTLGLYLVSGPDPGDRLYRGRPLRDGLVLFAPLPPAAGPPTVEIGWKDGDVSEVEATELRRVTYAPGVFSRLLAENVPGAYLIEAPVRSVHGEESEGLDAAQEEALRALGYIQ